MAVKSEQPTQVAVLALLTLLLSLPALLVQVPPLPDLHAHLARYYLEDPAGHAALRAYFDYHWELSGNLGGDAVVYVLAHFLGVEGAAKLLASAIPVIMAAGMLLLAREANGKTPITAAAALAITYAWPFQMGFLNYWLSVGLAFLSAALWIRKGRQSRTRLRAVLFLIIGPAVWITHVSGWGVLGLICWTYELSQRRDLPFPRRLFFASTACLPLAAPLVLMMVWSSGDGFTLAAWPRVGIKFQWFVGVFRDRWLIFDVASLVFVIAVIVLPFVARQRFAYSPSLFAAGAALLLIAAVSPELVLSSMFAASRLFPVALALLVLSVNDTAATSARQRQLVAWSCVGFCAARLLGTALSWHLYDASYRREFQLMSFIPARSKVAAFVGQPCPPRKLEVWTEYPWSTMGNGQRLDHIPAFAIIRKQAFVNALFAGPGFPGVEFRYPQAGRFIDDSSSHVSMEPSGCAGNFPPTLSSNLRTLPFKAFDFVWLVDVPPQVWPRDRRLSLVASNGRSALYRVNDRAIANH
jgi:hypothetical protein